MTEPTTEAGRYLAAFTYGLLTPDAINDEPQRDECKRLVVAVEQQARQSGDAALDVELVAAMRQRPEFRFAATSDDFAREYARLAAARPARPESAE